MRKCERSENEKEKIDKQLVRQLKHELISADWMAEAKFQDDEKYSYFVRASQDIHLPKDLKVMVGLLCSPGFDQVFSEPLIWKDIELAHISSLIPVKIMTHTDEIIERLVIQSELCIEGGDSREDLVLKQLINSEDKFLNYIRLLLQNEPDKEKWMAMEKTMVNGRGIGGLDWKMPIFEQLMIAASRYPEQLKRIDQLLKKLEDLDSIIPKEFLELWGQFSVFAEGKA